ncbi:FAD-linked oxidoreductase [Mycena pura]|uniref:Proline dehydrogenase n=1 Tax=Mycena pura TaxID=153505 RepID=A0AAD6YLS0_9AGAR|nr:FAD-linked oxidoreductase [Mycena pura]
MLRLRLPRTLLQRCAPVPRPPGARGTSRMPPWPSGTGGPRTGRPLALASGGAALGLAALIGSKMHADAAAAAALPLAVRQDDDPERKGRDSLRALVRTYVVYSLCSIPALVDNAPWLLETFSRIPGLKRITEALVRATFFDQFVGGDSAAETLPLLKVLRTANTGALFAYSVEVDEAQATATAAAGASQSSPHKAIVAEMLHCIDVAADFEDSLGATQAGRRTWVAVKLTALLPDASALIRLSSHIIATRPPTSPPLVVFPGNPTASDLDVLHVPAAPRGDLSDADLAALRALHTDLEAICTRAAARGVRVIIDAEYSWYEPAIDAFALALMRRFNAGPAGPLVYATFQAYLRRTRAHLVHALRDAQAHGYALGAKLVRGAYHPHEAAAHGRGAAGTLSISPDALPPVWGVKTDTDASYDACAALLLGAVAADVASGRRAPQGVGVLFGTHNWASCRKILAGLAERGLGRMTAEGTLRADERVGERVTFGQLYGAYVPYGALADVMPYLSRRAIENKSVLGGTTAQTERARAWAQIRKRVLG